ncbi:glycosyltransferase [Pseudodesulfovibrio cashew]|uniref:Glycosyltransferase n=1 Tax=Pseudodesulfovibrio cashew TaxID=2678688 RepID=A0A6I6JIV3_9BACT|nr:glycosyltransferase family 2 protein [Pseudodesulfovibrio cashew]QGY40323.1 glycosyltransferase [Pseudodesulfovibrio cashew]
MTSLLSPGRLIVLIPCYNCEAFIGPCLDSLLAQTHADWTAVVADDCSTDGTRQVIEGYSDPRIVPSFGAERRYLMGNIVANLRALDLQPSDVVAVLDGDDMLKPEALPEVWAAHRAGYDLVWTDEELLGAEGHSIGGPLKPNLPVRRQEWCVSHVRSFKGYLFTLMDDADFRDEGGRYFRAAGDLSLYLPMAELAGIGKTRFIDRQLYVYRVHDNCNFKVKRQEQLDNNWLIRSRTPYEPQTEFFDVVVDADGLEKAAIRPTAQALETRYPAPLTICLRHRIARSEEDSWRAYHNLWVGGRVYLKKELA